MFKRKIAQRIEKYIEENEEKILIIHGARQVGKSYIIRYVCKNMIKNFVEINLAADYEGDRLFERVKNIRDFYIQVSVLFGDKLGNKNNTMIFLDEIQVYPHLLSMLKQLKEDGRYRYIVSGSLLGITLRHSFIPMGAVIEEKMFPMDFEEYLWAAGVGEEVISYLRECYLSKKDVSESIHNQILRKFKEYLICGGLPDAVKAFLIDNNIQKTRDIHEITYNFYKDDASRYDSLNKLKINRIYTMLQSYMENKAKRLLLNKIENKNGMSYVDYQDEFDYLLSSGIALGVDAISEPKYPLSRSISKNLVKLYYNDVGILTYLLFRNDVRTILDNDSGVNLGSVYETVVATELSAHKHELYYFDNKKIGEVDFLLNDYQNASVLPIEVKSGRKGYNFRAIPKLVNPDYEYKLPLGYVLTNKNIIKIEDRLITIPIYMVMFL